jgi:signal transduction histidine kinase/CheY-like chemotaxis protein/CHASE3 domain sensor protein
MKTNLKSNLLIGLGLSLLILFMSSLASFISIKNLIQSSDQVKKSTDLIISTQLILSAIKDAETGQRGYLLTGNKVFLEPYQGSVDEAYRLLTVFQEETKDNPSHQKKAKELKDLLTKRFGLLQSTIEIKSKGGIIEEEALLKGKSYMDSARRIVKEMGITEKEALLIQSKKLEQFIRYTPIFIIIAALLSFLVTLYFYRRISKDHDERLELHKELEQNSNETVRRLTTIKEVATQISEGNYELRLNSTATDDLGELAHSLNRMASELKKSFGKIEESKWLQTGIASLSIQMVGDKDIFDLSDGIIEFIAKYTNSQIGAIYAFKDDGYLHLKGRYALQKNQIPEVLEIGEGLIGQSIKSGEHILITDVPQNELTITHAIGLIKPKQLLVYPIIRNGITVGGIELGTINEFTNQHLLFLKLVTPEIGTSIISAQNRQKLQALLEETQAQSEELQMQHHELESMNAELEVQSQRLQVSEEELKVQQEELLQSNQELEERNSLLEEKNQLIALRNEEIQEKAQALELSTKYKSEFLANMSHELRTPLNSILLLSRLMAENDEFDEEYKEYASVIHSSGQGLLSLIDEILDLSKIESGKMTLDLEEVDVDDIILDLQRLFKPLATEKGINFSIDKAKDLLEPINTDKQRLEQILKNLLSNAIKFTAKGHVKLNIYKTPANNTINFKVDDSGIGISEKNQSLIFEAFQQADGSTRRKFGGTGLGLSISRELAKLLGGKISLASQEGQGSVFILTIPLNKELEIILPSSQISDEILVEKSSTDNLTVAHIPEEIEDDRNFLTSNDKIILIIEDDTPFAKTLLNFARRNNYKGLVAVRGDVGVDMALKYQPTAILLDIQLPIKNGWQVMDELKTNPKTKAIPVHIMSSFQSRKESLLKGAVDFINKPFAFDEMHLIFEKLEQALKNGNKKVLIVEENDQHAQALSYFLQNFNIQSEVVNQLNTSISALHKPEINCVILDMGVPNKQAYETLEIIKKTKGLEDLPIIVFTGKNLSKGEASRIQQYADSIVLKTAQSYKRILDEASLFLHLVEEKSSITQNTRKKFSELQDVLKDKTILIADDDVRNIFSLSKILEQYKITVLTATDGKEALKCLHENPQIDAVLMDMMMPELDGYETTSAIRKIPKYKYLPILAITAKAMMGDREKCIEAGASDYISKPVDMDQLISLLRVWMYENHHKE